MRVVGKVVAPAETVSYHYSLLEPQWRAARQLDSSRGQPAEGTTGIWTLGKVLATTLSADMLIGKELAG